MHPAKSVIFFTVLSGLGLGILNVVCLSVISHGMTARIGILLVAGLACLAGGLLSSFAHLGNPQRAWRAFSQWQSSWLSREGCLACLAFVMPIWWIVSPPSGAILVVSAVVAIVINVATIHCTAMIYASLRAIPAWHNFFTPMNYQLLSLLSGFMVTLFIISLFGVTPPFMRYFIVVLAVLAAVGKFHYWKFLNMERAHFTANQATGIGGDLSPFDPPHTSRNYLMKEMIFIWGREKQKALQIFTAVTVFLFPAVSGFLVHWQGGIIGIFISGGACLFMLAGLFVERWLFFACAQHSVSLYYGREKI